MKKLLLMIMAIAAIAFMVIGFIIPAGGAVSMAAAITLPTQKMIFLTSLKEEYNKIETWLNEAEDLSSWAADGQTLVFPEAGADPAVYKNRITDIDNVEPEETVYKTELDVYDSQNYKIRNVYLHALPFEKVQFYTRKSSDAIIRQEVADAAYAFAPDGDGNKRIIIPTTGDVVGGLKSMTLTDIITLAANCDKYEFPDGRNLVLPSDMWWQLVNSNPILKGQLERQTQNGIINPKVVEYYDIKIHKSLGNKLGIAWDITGEKKASQGATIDVENGIVPAALFFCANQVYRAGGKMEMFYMDKSSNTSGRAYEFGFQHRFKADFQMSAQRYSGMIYSDKA